ncbi:hypothetical protein Tco_1174425 [Tanacetum coccineum]
MIQVELSLISASSASVSFPDLLLSSCTVESVLMLFVSTKSASNALPVSSYSLGLHLQNAMNEAKRIVLRQNAMNEAKCNVLRQNATNEAKHNVLRQNATNEAKRSVLGKMQRRRAKSNEENTPSVRLNAANNSYEHILETIFGREVNQVHVLDFAGLTGGMRQTLANRLSMVYTRDAGEAFFTSHAWRRLFEFRGPLLGRVRRRMTWRQFILALGLHSEEEMAEARFGAYWSGSKRVILNKEDLRDYWIEISSDKDFLGSAPSYVHIKDPVRRLCHKMITCSISGRGQGAKKVTRVNLFYLRTMDQGTANVPYLLAQYLFRHAEGRKSRARLSGGYYIGFLAAHFGLVSNEGLRGLSIIGRELSVIDLHDLARLNICSRFGDTWAWVAHGLERQQAAAAGTPGAAEDAPAADEGVVESSITKQTRVSTWMISCMMQLMDASGRTYQAFDSTLVNSSRLSYQRCVRPRIDDVGTSTAPLTNDQPDP